MYIIYVDFVLKNKMEIKKLGLTFRKISSKERKFLTEQIAIVLKYRKDIKHLYNKYEMETSNSNNYLFDIMNFDLPKRDIIMSGYSLLNSGFKFNSKNKIDYILEHLLVIECDERKIYKYIEKNCIKRFISNLLNLYNIYTDTINIKNMVTDRDYTLILDDNLLLGNSEFFYNDILMNIVLSYSDEGKKIKNHILKHIELNEIYLKVISSFIDNLIEEDIFKFFEILDMLYSQTYTIQNKILNYVTIVESLIINENDNIQKSYVLKGGMILKQYLGSESSSSNEAIKLLLNFVYEIRSDIIHGNFKKIENDLNKINQKNKKVKELIGEVPEFISKKDKAFKVAYTISLFVARSIVKYWIDFPYKVQYLKKN